MEVLSSISDLSRKDINFSHPLSSYDFFKLLEDSKSVSPESGWHPIYFKDKENFSYSYIKTHSYGEYIFDWSWADLYQRLNLNYYPKLIHALPFSPLNAPKFQVEDKSFYRKIFDFYIHQKELSSHHYLFISKKLSHELESIGYFTKMTLQFHFDNDYKSFDEYLDSLKSRKRKQIKKERKKAKELNYEIRQIEFASLDNYQLGEIYKLYSHTIEKKHSHSYLSQDFFMNLNTLKNGFVFLAYEGEKIVAMSLFFYNDKALYGRYWGSTSDNQYLHFEMCYYLGIDYCIEHNIPLFEAGAQGEQKLLRGFKPKIIYSAHHLRDSKLYQVIKDHTLLENQHIQNQLKSLESYLPFKH